MSGPDQPAEPHRRPDGVEPNEAETTVVDARALGADQSAPPSGPDVPHAWSHTAEESAPTTATPYPRTYRTVDDDDPTDAPLADTPGTFGGAPVPESTDRPASPYAAPATAAGPIAPSADPAPAASAAPTSEPDHDEVRDDAPTVTTSRDELASASPSTDVPGSTSAYQPFQSTAVPAVAPFPPSGSRADGVPRTDGSTTLSAPEDATRALPRSDDAQPGGAQSGDAQDVFDRPYPAGPQPLAQPEYIPPPQPQPNALDERDTFIGQPARPDEPELLPEKRRIWQNLLGALIGLLLVLGPIIGFALLAGTPDSLFDTQLARRFLVLGIIVLAAVPALLAGWAPATAWFAGGILAVVGTIAFLSSSFTNQLVRWSTSLFDTGVVGIFVAQYAVVIGFVLLFAGLGAAWGRSSAADSVLRRIPTRP